MPTQRSRTIAALTFIVALATTAVAIGFPHAGPAVADTPVSTSGWLEGTVLTDTGTTVSYRFNGSPVIVHGTRRGGGSFDVPADISMGGLYTAQAITPGTYDLSIQETMGPFRPTRMLGVVVEAGQRTVLNIALQPGEALDERGSPGVRTVTLTSTGDDIDKLRAEVAALGTRVATLEAHATK